MWEEVKYGEQEKPWREPALARATVKLVMFWRAVREINDWLCL